MLEQLRKGYHKAVCQRILGYQAGVPNLADMRLRSSIKSAQGIFTRMGYSFCTNPPDRERAELLFESITRDYLEKAFGVVDHLHPGAWTISVHRGAPAFDQYQYLAQLIEALKQYPHLGAKLRDYLAMPGILMGRTPVLEREVNHDDKILQGSIANLTPLLARNSLDPKPILYASIFCKWTLRSVRSRNAQVDALNLIRNRKGNLPHIVAVTAEPLPTRIASLALGTGDLDCVYHFALPELTEAIRESDNEDQMDMLQTLVRGRRLRDITDLPFDLAI